MIETGATMWSVRAGRWRLGLAFPRYWHPWVRFRWKPFWLYLPCLRVWRDS